MGKWEHNNRYGLLIMEIMEGRYFWSEWSQTVVFVSAGHSHASWGRTLTERQNTRAGAVKYLCRVISKG